MRRAAVLLGMGLGGFLDGIVLHQVLQWHHMLSAQGCCPQGTIAGLEDNTLADGLFHVATWVMVVAAVIWLWKATRQGEALAGRVLAGLVLAGWGAFNLIEGLVDHHLLGLHHVKEGDGQLVLDLGFLALGALLVALGTAMAAHELDPFRSPNTWAYGCGWAADAQSHPHEFSRRGVPHGGTHTTGGQAR